MYCNIRSFIVNALVLLTKKFLTLFAVLPAHANLIYRVMARMQPNQMKATQAISYVPETYGYISFDWLVSAVFHRKLTPIFSCQRVPG